MSPNTTPTRGCIGEVRAELVCEVVVAVVCLECFPVVIFCGEEEVVIGESWRGERVGVVEVGEAALCIPEVVVAACVGHQCAELVVMLFEEGEAVLYGLFVVSF